MFSFVRLILLTLFASSIIMGGVGVQQGDSSFLKGGAGLLAVALLLIVVYKIIWKAIGCLIVIGLIVIGSFMLFSGSGSMPDLGSIGQMMSSMKEEKKIDATKTEEELSKAQETSANTTAPMLNEIEEDEDNFLKQDLLQDYAPKPQPEKQVQKQIPQEQPEPEPQPAQNIISGVARVINGDTIQIGNRIIRLFGIDAPEPNQTCANRSGTSYRCGQKAAQELRKMLGNSDVACNIMQQNSKGHAIGTCSVGVYDVGAAMVINGWAVAYRQFSGDVYVPYENKARTEQIGLWEGEFYMPWDWREHNTIQKKAMLDNVIPSQGGSSSSSSSSMVEGLVGSLLKMF
ncbi:MAG: thermonuclease family protein [Alphaproteobacteria bacterium]